ncbi:uncharacterized protein B0P05DRAFT_527835 [Gilbertella persicaria]|uniref:uncharacterized protein n=1 Tax=Gilbertella persicaria TaxID=101096 RepID=UPI00221E938C|nr:uncharacterized protein B0P05DRAFT_527835 [Gilbertella persicaria]KAI8090891.1 hypothetical protein B0P05DRAFT_527835 [Gilbertella persicaria]
MLTIVVSYASSLVDSSQCCESCFCDQESKSYCTCDKESIDKHYHCSCSMAQSIATSLNRDKDHEALSQKKITSPRPTSTMIHSTTTSIHQRRTRKCRFHTRLFVFSTFLFIILGAITAFFCWPRTPRVSMDGGADSLEPLDWTPMMPSRSSLRAAWQINVTLDNRDNWIPTRLTKLDFVMVDSLTQAKFAWASTNAPIVLAPGTISPISLTFNVNYQAADRNDPTFQNLYHACTADKERHSLNVLLRVSFHIFGLLWTPLVIATPYTGGVLCPINK